MFHVENCRVLFGGSQQNEKNEAFRTPFFCWKYHATTSPTKNENPRRWTKSVLHWDRPCNGEEFLVTLASISVVEVSPGYFLLSTLLFSRDYLDDFTTYSCLPWKLTRRLPKHFWRWLSFPQVGYVSPWRVLHFYHELIFIIPNFMQPKVNILSDMQLTLPFIKVQRSNKISEKNWHTVDVRSSFFLAPWRKHVLYLHHTFYDIAIDSITRTDFFISNTSNVWIMRRNHLRNDENIRVHWLVIYSPPLFCLYCWCFRNPKQTRWDIYIYKKTL